MTGIEERPSKPNRALSERGGVVREKKMAPGARRGPGQEGVG